MPCVFDGAINGEPFCAWVEQALAPTLAPGDLVIMGQLGAHKVEGLRAGIEARGAQLLYLPPSSPDLNPIEQVFAKLKVLLRNAGTRIVDGHWHAIGQALDPSRPPECAGYLAHAGYVPSIDNRSKPRARILSRSAIDAFHRSDTATRQNHDQCGLQSGRPKREALQSGTAPLPLDSSTSSLSSTAREWR